MATIVANATGGNWSTTGAWTGGVVPGAGDDVQLNSGSANITINGARACRSLDCTGYTNTLTHNSSSTLSIGDGTAGLSNIALKLVSGMTYTLGGATTSAISFVSTSSTQQTVDYGGKTGGNATFNGAGGSWLLSTALSTGTSGNVNLTAGTLDTNGQSVTTQTFTSSGSSTRVLTLGASTITVNLTAAAAGWDLTSTGMTFSGASSTIAFTGVSANTKTFNGAGLTYGTFTHTVAASTGQVNITGSNTFDTINFSDTTNARTLAFTAATTTTVRLFNVRGLSGKLMTVTSITAATHTLTKPTGTVATDFLSVSQSIATGGAAWFAGSGSTDGGSNTGWLFAGAPIGFLSQVNPSRLPPVRASTG